tara:strand:- start:37286 stop:37543 length:258 start_codon:yes stop_codon:yes gene_type:complete
MTKSVFSDGYNELLALLVESRKAAGMTQVELAERLQRPQPFISYLERGERRVDVVEFIAIARAIGVSPAELFGRLLSKMPENNPI